MLIVTNKNRNNHSILPLLGWMGLLVWLLSSCSTTKYLGEDQYLLRKNKIVLEETGKIKNKSDLRYELSRLYKQKPNNKFFFFFPREGFYYRNLDTGDTTKWKKFIKRTLAEPPSIYEEEKSQATAESMQYYLQYHGYFDAQVYFTRYFNRGKASVAYHVQPKERYLIDSLSYVSRDPVIDSLVARISDETLLQPGEPMDGSSFEREKERISSYLRNRGYADFYSNYFSPLEADSADHKVNLKLEILTPVNQNTHKVFQIGRITLYPDYNPLVDLSNLQDTIIRGVHFRSNSDEFWIKPGLLVDNIFLKPGDLFRDEEYQKTNQQLVQLGVFRFVTIRQEVDTIDNNLINFNIFLTPNKRMEIGFDTDLNFTDRQANFANLVGVSFSPTYRNRNLQRGAELFSTNLQAGVEFDPFPRTLDSLINTLDISLQTDLLLPQFVDYLGSWRLLRKVGLKRLYTQMKEQASTRLSAGYQYSDFLNFYRLSLLNASFGYDLQPNANTRLQINHLAIDYLRPVTRPAFDNIARDNLRLRNSFGQQLFVSMLLRDITFQHTSRSGRYDGSQSLKINFETAGTEIWLGNSIYNALALNADTLRVFNSVNFSQYAKLDIDSRWLYPLTPTQDLAFRANLGIALPFGYSTEVPYVKQFAIGGPYSIRAWRSRELGVGNYLDPITDTTSNPLYFYLTGDMKIELNAEYRFPIFSYLNGALFVDAGNVWNLREDTTRCGSQFSWGRKPCGPENVVVEPFWKQMAIGAGFGLRMDFSYFILRVDFGYKVRYPHRRPETGSFWAIQNLSEVRIFRDANVNFGLGYSF